MPQQLTDSVRKRIAAAVAVAEANSAAEIVCVIARSSSSYALFPVVWAAALALMTPAPLIAFTELSAQRIYIWQGLLFIAAALVLSLDMLRFHIVPRAVKRAQCFDMALRQFRIRAVAATRGRTGVLIFVSMGEHYARIVVDDAVAARVPQQRWQDAVDALVDGMAEGRIADGYVAAIERCAAILAEAMPRSADDSDELPNRIVLL